MTQTRNRRNRPTHRDQFRKVQAYIHPQNIATLRSEARQYGQSMSEVVNDAVMIYCGMLRGEPVFGSRGKR